MMELQRVFRVNRYKQIQGIIGEENELAQGLVWGSYPRDAIEYCFQYSDSHPDFCEWLSKGQAAEEFFFQTILANSEKYAERITNHHYRYMNWTRKNNSYPGILDREDYLSIKQGNYHFCRKIDMSISAELIDLLNKDSKQNWTE